MIPMGNLRPYCHHCGEQRIKEQTIYDASSDEYFCIKCKLSMGSARDMMLGELLHVPHIPAGDRRFTPRVKNEFPSGAEFWGAIDEQIDYLMYLGHSRECMCNACNRRDRLIALLLEGMS